MLIALCQQILKPQNFSPQPVINLACNDTKQLPPTLNLHIGQFQYLSVTKTRQYQYLKGTCSDDNFFQCVALNLAMSKICNVSGVPCAPYSLTGKDYLNEFPMCPVQIVLDCYVEFSKLAWPACRKHKSCSITEYSSQELYRESQDEVSEHKWNKERGFEGTGFKRTRTNSFQFSLY